MLRPGGVWAGDGGFSGELCGGQVLPLSGSLSSSWLRAGILALLGSIDTG